MRKYISFLMVLMLLPLALAQETNEESQGITPDSFLWGVDQALEQISLLLAANPEAKAVKGLEIAQERLLEIKLMAEEKNLPALEKAQSAHSKILLKVKENIKSLEEENPEDLLETELELEKELQEHQEEIEEIELKLKVKIKIEGVLSAEQQARLDDFLASLGESAGEIKIEIKNKKDETKIKIKAKTGKSEEEIDEEVEKLERKKGLLEERIKVRAEIVDGKSFVKVDLKFDSSTTDKEALLAEIVKKFSLDTETAASLLKVEEEEEAEVGEERLRVKVKTEEDGSEATVKLRFSLDSIDTAAIVNALVEKTQLTAEQVESVWQVKEKKAEEDKEEKEIEIEVEIEDGEAEIKVESDGGKMKFVLQETDREKIIQEIALRLEISAEEVLKFVAFEEKRDEEELEAEDDEAEDKEEDDDKDEIEDDGKGSNKNLIGGAVKESNSKDSENGEDDSGDSDSNGGGSSDSSGSGGSSGNSGSGGSSGNGGSNGGSSSGSSGGNGGDD